jgi:hypothetical protein
LVECPLFKICEQQLRLANPVPVAIGQGVLTKKIFPYVFFNGKTFVLYAAKTRRKGAFYIKKHLNPYKILAGPLSAARPKFFLKKTDNR